MITKEPGKPAVTILVAEDEVLVRHEISEYLRSQGYGVVEANSAAEAIQVFKDSVDVTVVFTDVRMPGTIDGLDLAHYVQSHHPDVPVVITSGHVRPADIPADLGPIIEKPYTPVDVLEAIKAKLQTN
jgi:CheY-like chemotaxis protein